MIRAFLGEVRPKAYLHITIMQEEWCTMPKHKVKIEYRRREIVCRCRELMEVFPDCSWLKLASEIGTYVMGFC